MVNPTGRPQTPTEFSSTVTPLCSAILIAGSSGFEDSNLHLPLSSKKQPTTACRKMKHTKRKSGWRKKQQRRGGPPVIDDTIVGIDDITAVRNPFLFGAAVYRIDILYANGRKETWQTPNRILMDQWIASYRTYRREQDRIQMRRSISMRRSKDATDASSSPTARRRVFKNDRWLAESSPARSPRRHRAAGTRGFSSPEKKKKKDKTTRAEGDNIVRNREQIDSQRSEIQILKRDLVEARSKITDLEDVRSHLRFICPPSHTVCNFFLATFSHNI